MLRREKKSIRIGLIGGGFMAKAHSNAYNTIPYIFHEADFKPELVALGAVTLEEAVAAADRYGYRDAYEGYEEVVAREDIDVIDICISDRLHTQVALAAIRAGKHVLCEKPLALTKEDAKTMTEAAAKAGVKTMCGYNYRFIPAVTLAKRLIDTGKMGRVYSFDASFCQDVGAYEETPVEKLWYAYGPKASGALLGIGTHIVDLMRYFTGEPESVIGQTMNYTPHRKNAGGEDYKVTQDEEAMALVQCKSGSSAILRSSAVAAGRKNCLRWELSCAKGTLAFDLENLNYLEVFHKDKILSETPGFTKVNVTQIDCNHPYMEAWWPRGHLLGWEHAHINEIAYFLACVADDKPVPPQGATFYDGLRNLEIIDAIQRSSEEGRRITFDTGETL